MPKNKKKCFSYELNLVKVFKDTLFSTGLKEITTLTAGIISELRVLIYYDHRCLYSNPQPQLSVSGKYLNNIFL